jgi:hypothetical protein
VTRWTEEVRLVPEEMNWTILWFKNKKSEWKEWANCSEAPHLKAYAERQAYQWDQLAHRAQEGFEWARTHKKAERKWKSPPSA